MGVVSGLETVGSPGGSFCLSLANLPELLEQVAGMLSQPVF